LKRSQNAPSAPAASENSAKSTGLRRYALAQRVRGDQIRVLARRGQHDHRQQPGLGSGADPAQDLEPADPRHLEIEQDHRRLHHRVAAFVLAGREQVVEGLRPVAGDRDLARHPGALEREQRELLVARVVLDEQDQLGHGGSPAAWPWNVK
jgi:hypothetical protein